MQTCFRILCVRFRLDDVLAVSFSTMFFVALRKFLVRLHPLNFDSPRSFLLLGKTDTSLQDTMPAASDPAVCLALLIRLRLLGAIGVILTLAGLEPAIFGSEDQRLIH